MMEKRRKFKKEQVQKCNLMQVFLIFQTGFPYDFNTLIFSFKFKKWEHKTVSVQGSSIGINWDLNVDNLALV